MEKNMLADVLREGESLDEIIAKRDGQVEEPAESQTEETKEEEVVEEDDSNKPFHKQSRWKKMREELDEERSLREQKDQDLEEERQARLSLETRLSAIEKGEVSRETTDQPEFLKVLVGENEDVARTFKSYEEELLQKAEERILKRQQTDAQAKQKQIEDANAFIETQISKVEKSYGVSLKAGSSERNELLKTVYEYAPTDAQNNYDFEKGFKILKALKQGETEVENTKVEARKVIADSTTSKNTGGKETKTFVTANDIRKAGGFMGFLKK